MPARPPFLLRSQDVPEEVHHYPNSDEDLAPSRPIGRVAGLQRIGLHLTRVPPGARTSWPHCEEHEEEFVFVIEGALDAWIDGVLHPMAAGDLAAFPCGTGICHTFINNGDHDAVLLVGGETPKANNRIYYPRHPHRQADLPPSEWWDDVPAREQGPHDGLPDALRSKA